MLARSLSTSNNYGLLMVEPRVAADQWYASAQPFLT